MARKRYKPEEIVAKLKDRCSGLAGDVARRHDRAGPCQAGQALEAPCAPENACCEGLAWAACKVALHAPLQHQSRSWRGLSRLGSFSEVRILSGWNYCLN